MVYTQVQVEDEDIITSYFSRFKESALKKFSRQKIQPVKKQSFQVIRISPFKNPLTLNNTFSR